MAIIDRLRSIVAGMGPISESDNAGDIAGGGAFSAIFDAGIARDIVSSLDAGDLYATQPHLRTVVSFIARNGAQLGRHVYTKTDDGRDRVDSGPLAQLMKTPNEYMTGYDLFDMLFSELALYDMAIWVPSLRAGKWVVDPIPGAWVTGIKKASAFQMAGYRVKDPTKTEETFIPANQAIVFRGYSPDGFQRGSSTVRSLKGILEEQVSAMDFRSQMWKRGGRVGMFMTRPAAAAVWSPEAKAKFIQSWRNNWSGNGANAGSTPLLEDGMELKRVGFNAKEEQWLEAATLSLSTVAASYHVPPAMVGVSGYNSFASVKEFRKMLYTETMGPVIAQVEDTINTFLAPFVGEPANHYLELNIGEKLQGDFEEQATQFKDAVGGPYMTPNEARLKQNLPKIEGGDKLLAPLNMGAAGNNGPAAGAPIATEPSGASEPDPTDDKPPVAPKALTTDPLRGVKASAPNGVGAISDDKLEGLEKSLTSYFAKQHRVTAAAVNTKDTSWWDSKSWNNELKSILLPYLLSLSVGAAEDVAGAKGLDPADYSMARTVAFLNAVAASRADLINSTTFDALVEALKTAQDGDTAAKAVTTYFEQTNADRAKTASRTLATFVGSFAATEVARQLMKSPTKTWVTSGSPKSRHANMNGETVPVDQKFSNGADWPGDPVLGAGGVANCLCGCDINDND